MPIKKIVLGFLVGLLLTLTAAPSVLAVSTVLPENAQANELTPQQCAEAVRSLDVIAEEERFNVLSSDSDAASFFMACGIKSGEIKLWMVPYFIRNILGWLIGLAGLIAILMILLGAYFYIAGGITDDKEKGKKIITYAIGGLILSTLAWFIVNVILLAITS